MEALEKKLHFNIITLLTLTCYHNNAKYRPDILDISLMKGVVLKLSCNETLQCLNADHRPVLVRLGSLAGDCPPPTKTIISWKKMSVSLEKTDTPILYNIPNDIASTDDIDNSAGVPTSHIRIVVENSSRTVPTKSGRRELPRDRKVKVKAHMKEVRNENWSKLMAEISPNHKAYRGLVKDLKTEGAVPTSALKDRIVLSCSMTGKNPNA
ncbi:hypothetical protein EVAR_61125_1 [Eumeta japonica]|uniref:Uncharacterized protein n=1 Tax=Eumeta variegata TaxID=151549 RepID=A0A4C1ZCX8_EUMVA|nr:hypothetical protein EVAR_61125_1 [Eumeta japonica]